LLHSHDTPHRADTTTTGHRHAVWLRIGQPRSGRHQLPAPGRGDDPARAAGAVPGAGGGLGRWGEGWAAGERFGGLWAAVGAYLIIGNERRWGWMAAGW